MTKPTIVLRNRDGQWTNEHGIEPVLFSQLTSDNYPHHDDDPYTWSATELVDPTNLTVLTRRHRAERVIDASAMVHSHIGRALHYYDHVHAVKHTPVFSEDRLDVSILVDGDNYTITGQADKYEPWWYFRGEPAPTDADDDEWAVVDNKFTSLAGWKREDFAKWTSS